MENKIENTGTAKLTIGDESYDLPIYSGSMGAPAIDVRALYKHSGHFTFDPGFTSTCSTESQLTFIDGGKGQLLHRGYSIEDLAEKCDFMEIAYLMMNGELPNKEQFETFSAEIKSHSALPEQAKEFFKGFPKDTHPMAMICGVTGALSGFYHEETDVADDESRNLAMTRLIAKIPTIAALAYKHSLGEDSVDPDASLNYAENFLKMCFGSAKDGYEVNPVIAKTMNKIFILHADHEQNASTSTVRLAGSSGANPYACIAAGIACLWGPSHGGANDIPPYGLWSPRL